MAYYARIVKSVGKKEKYKRSVLCLTQSSLFVTDLKGDVLACLKLDRISEVLTEDVAVKHTVVGSKHIEKHVLFKCPTAVDVLLSLAADKENSTQCNDDDLCMTYIKVLLAASGNPVEIRPAPSWQRIQAMADFDPPEGYVDPQTFLAEMMRDQVDVPTSGLEVTAGAANLGRDRAGSRKSETPEGTRSARSPALPSPDYMYSMEPMAIPSPPPAAAPASASTAELEELRAREAIAQSKLQNAAGEVAAAKKEMEVLKKQLASERAARDDIVRDLRSDFDAKFIKKQAEEFDLRNRQHQRVREKDTERICELQERLAEPRTYTGPDELLGRIAALEKAVASLDAQLDVERSKALHFQDVADEQRQTALTCHEFIHNSALPRIRDLQAGKDFRVLPLLGKIPEPPIEVRGFRYQPGAAAPAPAASPDLGLDSPTISLSLSPTAGHRGPSLGAEIDLGSLSPGGGAERVADDIDLDSLSLGSPKRAASAASPRSEIDLDI
eukprot:TRINITY_DN10319_c1_g1_i1.p1 TRINITY_DN10319_c1_g1~~TRINITY_DN10319_c1_g1_i1.p1  ORF type:complete len:565 (+),score=176.18 TRINITY_DN10319_c1_g1_i1:202-1695(+)